MADFLDIDDVRAFVRDWNVKYPIDRWWRDKYNIPFGSPQHLSQSLLDMRIAFEDEHLHMRLKEQYLKEQEEEEKGENTYRPGRGDWLKKQAKFKKMSGDDVDAAFHKLASDLDNLQSITKKSGKDGKQTITV